MAIFGTVFVAVGDITSLIRHNRNKEEAFNDLLKIKDKVGFTDKDLILTRNGVEHIANWFLNSKSSLITSFNLNDFSTYDRIFIMNPTEGAMKLQSVTNADNQKYNYMLSNIEEPIEGEIVYNSEHIKLIQVMSPPKNWKFDKEGKWTGY